MWRRRLGPLRVLSRGRALHSAIWKERVNEEVDAELRFHVDMLTQRYVAQGMTPADARAQALRKFGSVERVAHTCEAIGEERERRMRWTEWAADLRQDIGFAVRQFGRARGFTVTAVLTLMLGLGAITAIFSVVDGVLVQPLPLSEPDRVVHVYSGMYANGVGGQVSPLNFLDWRAQNRSFVEMAATNSATANLTGGCRPSSAACEPQRLRALAVSANYFATLGAHTALGRTFAPGEDQPGAPRVAIISHDLWQSRFGADSGLVGREITINGEATTVVGVAEAGMTELTATQIWVPLIFPPDWLAPAARSSHFLNVFARLKPGVTVADAQRDVMAVVARLTQQYAETKQSRPIRVVGLHDDMVGDVTVPLLVLFGAVTLVLLIACANVANLSLVRAAGRGTEMAVRTALGAGRGRLVRQLLAESLLLSLIGGALGVMVAWCGVRLLTALAPGNIPRLGNVHLDGRVLAFAAVMALLTGVVFGLVPALAATRSNPAHSLRESGRGAGAGGGRLRNVLVVAEFAFSLMLLAGAGLLIKSFHRITTVDSGFRPEHLMTFTLDLPATTYSNPDAIRAFARTTTERLQQLPGVRSAALAFGMAESAVGISFTIPGHAPTSTSAPEPSALVPSVTSEFFEAMGIPVTAGRAFTPADRAGSAPVAILNSAAAQQYFPNEDPIGKTVRIDGLDSSSAPPREIVGVVGNTRTLFGPTSQPPAEIYLPLGQRPSPLLIAVIRTAGDPESILAAARAAVHEVDPMLPISHAWTMEERTARFAQRPRFYMTLLGTFAAVALVLASIGIYGVMSYAVSLRRHELGVRIALGATPLALMRFVVARGIALSAVGLIAGLAAAIGLSRVIASLLFEVTPTDVATYALVSAVLMVVALLACIVPARRAARVDPAIALRGG